MHEEIITKLFAELHHLHGSASEIAGVIAAALLLLGVISGFFLARWIFRGGLSRNLDLISAMHSKTIRTLLLIPDDLPFIAFQFGFHRLLAKWFPNAVYYRVAFEGVVVFQVLDCRRDPKLIREVLQDLNV